MADDGKLVFECDSDGAGRLVFGGGSGALPPAPPAHLALHGSLPGLGGITLRVARQLSLDGSLPGLDGGIGLRWDAGVSRGMRSEVRARWQDGRSAQGEAAAHWQDAPAASRQAASSWQDGAPRSARAASLGQNGALRSARAASGWQDSAPRSGRTANRWQTSLLLGCRAASGWQDSTPRSGRTASGWQEARRPLRLLAAHWQDAASCRQLLPHASGAGIPLIIAAASRWQDARRPPSGQSRVQPAQPGPVPCWDEATAGRLVFTQPQDACGLLLFVCGRGKPAAPPAAIYIPAQRSYIVINQIEIRRAGSAELLPAEAFGMTLDKDSWAWSFTAAFAASALPALMPAADGAPIELQVRINGQPFCLLAESISRSARFPGRLIKVSGRSKAALLDAPWAAVQTFANTQPRTAHQLMLDALTINGVSMGWSIDWQLTDWLVPAGAFMHQGSWISALNHIASAAGGYLQPHDTDTRLHVLPAWPLPWWRWNKAAPDIELPQGVAEIEETEWSEQPAYNRIFVSGETAGGILGDYKRAGTAGNVLHPMCTHPLITGEAAARQRATAELAESGRLIRQSLTLMVLPATGIIKPGRLLRYTDAQGTTRLGLVRATALQWAFPALTQTITLESHA